MRAAEDFVAASISLFLIGSGLIAADNDFAVYSSSDALPAPEADGPYSSWAGRTGILEPNKARTAGNDLATTAAPDALSPAIIDDGDQHPQRWREKIPPPPSGIVLGATGLDSAGGTSFAAQARHDPPIINALSKPSALPPLGPGEASLIGAGISIDSGDVLSASWWRQPLGLVPTADGGGGGRRGDDLVSSEHRRGRGLRGLGDGKPSTSLAAGDGTGGGRESVLRVATGSLVAGGVGGGDRVGRGGSAAAMAVVGTRRDLLLECPEGYFGDACAECATGFAETDDGQGCESVSQECTIANGFRAVFFIGAAFFVVMFTLDALWNSKSPTRRIAQMWRAKAAGSSEDATAMSDSGGRSPKQQLAFNRSASGKALRGPVSADEGCCDGVCWGREGLGRFFQGFMVFVVTAQIMTQGSEVMELKFPSAMQTTLSALQWTNFDPQSLVGSCVLPELPFFDRVHGTVGLLTACLGALFLSHAMLSLGGGSENSDRHADQSLGSSSGNSSSSRSSKGLPEARFLDGRSVAGAMDQSRSSGGSLSREPSHGSAAGLAGAGGWGVNVRLELEQRGAWERWNHWSSGERHVCVAVLVCLLLYPVLCTTLLRVWDCWSSDDGVGGRWLRADTSVECSSDEHNTYQMIAACFLGLYGIGLPLALVVMTLWAKGVDTDEPEADEDDDDNNDTTVAVRRLRGGALLHQGGGGNVHTAPPRGFAPREGGRGGRGEAAAPTDGGNLVASATSSPTLSGGEGGDDSHDAEGGREHTTHSAATASAAVQSREEGPTRADLTAARVATLRRGGGGRDSCCTRLSESKAWRASGRRVLATRRAMSSEPDRQSARTSKRWRSTIPVWSPYRANRHWFAAWELSRRLLLTGLLTVVSPDRAGEEYLRVAVACLLAGVALVVGEVARPHRDPWICWTYRAGSVIILLMNLAGLLQKAGAASVESPSMILLAGILIFLILVMAIFVCGGWRLSCAEQGRNAAVSAAIIPRGARSNLPRPAIGAGKNSKSRKGGGRRPNEVIVGALSTIPAAPESRGNNIKAPPRRLWSSDGHTSSGLNPAERAKRRPRVKEVVVVNGALGAGAGRERAGSERGDEARAPGDFSKRLPSYHELARYSRSDSGLIAPHTSSKHRHQASADSAVHVVNPMFSSSAAMDKVEVDFSGSGSNGSRYDGVGGERSSDRSGSGKRRRFHQQRQRSSGPFDRYMLSRSPKQPRAPNSFGGSGGGGSGGGILDRGAVIERGVFSSVSGSGSASMKSSIDAHLTANGGRFFSNAEAGVATSGGSISTVGVIPDRSRSNSGRNSLNSSNSFEGLVDVDGIGDAEVVFDRRDQLRASVELSSNGSTCSIKTTPSMTATAVAVAAAAAAAAAATTDADKEHAPAMPATRAPVLAPGAPTIDGHARRFASNKPLEGSSSSFASTSFESGTTGGNRALRNEQARVLASWRRSTGTSVYSMGSRSGTVSRVSSSGGSGSVTFGPPRPASRAGSGAASGISGGVGKVRGMMFRRNSSDASGSFLSQGSSSVASWKSPTGRSPVALREAYSRAGSSGPIEFEITAAAAAAAAAAIAAEEGDASEDGQNPIVGDSRNLGSDWVPTQTARGGWPLDLPSSSAMPRWWVKYASRSGGDSSQSDLAAGAPPDLVLAAAERAKAAEREAAAARVEAVFGDDNNDPERRFSNAGGGSNIVDFRAFVRAGGSGTSSFDSRATTASSEASRRREGSNRPTDAQDGGGAEGGNDGGGGVGIGVIAGERTGRGRSAEKEVGKKPTVRSRSSMSSGAANTPLTSAELKQHLDPDFEDEGMAGERPASFIRVAERVDKINARVGIKRGGSIQQLSPLPWTNSRGST